MDAVVDSSMLTFCPYAVCSQNSCVSKRRPASLVGRMFTFKSDGWYQGSKSLQMYVWAKCEKDVRWVEPFDLTFFPLSLSLCTIADEVAGGLTLLTESKKTSSLRTSAPCLNSPDNSKDFRVWEVSPPAPGAACWPRSLPALFLSHPSPVWQSGDSHWCLHLLPGHRLQLTTSHGRVSLISWRSVSSCKISDFPNLVSAA